MFVRILDLTKCGNRLCSGCGKSMMCCDDVCFGLFCVFEVISYINKKIKFVDDVVVKKIFIDTHNSCLRYTKFKEKKSVERELVFPPVCRQRIGIVGVLSYSTEMLDKIL